MDNKHYFFSLYKERISQVDSKLEEVKSGKCSWRELLFYDCLFLLKKLFLLLFIII